MPRPPSDKRMISIYLSESVIEDLDKRAAKIGGSMNRSKVIRALVNSALETPEAMKRFRALAKVYKDET